jgi:hypothetical protein
LGEDFLLPTFLPAEIFKDIIVNRMTQLKKLGMDITWRKAFMEIALRAFRKLHIESGAWGLGQSSNLTPNWENLNIGHGVELALETTVCAAISQEFINSPFTNGFYLKPNDSKERRYEIDREVTICGKRIDLFINRYKKNSNETVFYKYPVIIEAKRAHYFTSDISKGERGRLIEKVEGYNGLKNDLKMLREIRQKIKSKEYEITASGYENQQLDKKLNDVFLYLLFWGISENVKGQDCGNEPFSIANKIENNLLKDGNFELKWMPLKWRYLSNNEGSSYPEVSEWLWIMLIEVDQEKIGNPSFENDDDWFTKNNNITLTP